MAVLSTERSLVYCDTCPNPRTVRLGSCKKNRVTDACHAGSRQFKREVRPLPSYYQSARTVRLNGVCSRAGLAGQGLVNDMTVVNARHLARTIPRYQHGIGAGSRVYLA